MKYGMIYFHNTQNLGDDILSYAGKQFFPHTDYYIDREHLDCFMPENKEYVATIMNGWYLHNPYTFQPSPYLIPLFIGTHFSKDDRIFGDYSYLDGNANQYLKKHKPIGCRDIHTQEILQEKGIQSYFSGCLTLTLPPFPNVAPNHNIVLTDVSEEVVSHIHKLLPNKNIVCKTHELAPEEIGAPWLERQLRVEEYLKLYQGADLVITTRLHCALPSIALGTPVIFISNYDTDYADRISSFSDFFNACSKEELLSGNLDEAILHPTKDTKSISLAAAMTEHCTNFINNIEKEKFDLSSLPELALYKSLYLDRTEHMRNSISKLLEIRFELESQIKQDSYSIEKAVSISKLLLQENERLQKLLNNKDV